MPAFLWCAVYVGGSASRVLLFHLKGLGRCLSARGGIVPSGHNAQKRNLGEAAPPDFPEGFSDPWGRAAEL